MLTRREGEGLGFDPAPMHVVESPEQLKAFTDPLRTQVLAILAARPATNQQIADQLAQQQAKVLYHVRVLVDLGLAKLVDTQIKGGNIEKYYRAVARAFALRPGPDMFPELVNAGVEVLRQEIAASVAAWPDQQRWFETRSKRMSPERLREFAERVKALIAEHWDQTADDPDAPLVAFAVMTYRDPNDAARAQEP